MNAALTAVVVVFFVVFRPAVAAAEDAEQAFQAQFGEEYKRVKATPLPQDDVALAAKLLAAAKADDVAPGLLAILCERAYELGLKHPTGWDAAAEAMAILAERVPQKKAEAWTKAVDIRQKQYALAKGADRAAAGDALVEALLGAAAARKEAADPAQADALTKRAAAIAKLVGADPGDIQRQFDRSADRARLLTRVAEAKARVQANRQDAAARKELVALLLIEADDPAQAAQYHEESWPEPRFKYVRQAAVGPAKTSEPSALEMANWYESLAGGVAAGSAAGANPVEAPSPAARGAMLNRARNYYWRYLELHRRVDLDRTRAVGRLSAAEEAWRKQVPALAARTVAAGRSVDLLKWVDLKRDATIGTWEWQDAGLASSAAGRDDTFLTCCAPDGSYTLSMKVLLNTVGECVSVYLPVGNSRVQAALFFEKGVAVKAAGPGVFGETGPPVKGKEYAVDLKVTVDGNQADIGITLDGKLSLHWSGALSALMTDEDSPGIPCIRLSPRTCSVVFTRLRLDVVSGKARLLR
jgi:hypothetical protein